MTAVGHQSIISSIQAKKHAPDCFASALSTSRYSRQFMALLPLNPRRPALSLSFIKSGEPATAFAALAYFDIEMSPVQGSLRLGSLRRWSILRRRLASGVDLRHQGSNHSEARRVLSSAEILSVARSSRGAVGTFLAHSKACLSPSSSTTPHATAEGVTEDVSELSLCVIGFCYRSR